MQYYIMDCEGEYPSALIDEVPRLPEAPWMHGAIVNPPPSPLVYGHRARKGTNLCAMYSALEYPIIHVDLIEALRVAGVDNIQYFDAIVVAGKKRIERFDYRAFNIVGLVAAVDHSNAVRTDVSDSEFIDADFNGLAIDERKAWPHKIFRLAECVSAIIVADDVRKVIEQHKIAGMVFYDPSRWFG